MYLAVRNASSSESPQLIGLVAVADTLKTHAREAVSAVHRLDLKVAMLTGDNPRTARAIADLVKIDRVQAEVLLEQKTSEIRRLQNEGQVVAMLGDGINHAPAMRSACGGLGRRCLWAPEMNTSPCGHLRSGTILLIGQAMSGAFVRSRPHAPQHHY